MTYPRCDEARMAAGFGSTGERTSDQKPSTTPPLAQPMSLPSPGSIKRRVVDALLAGQHLTALDAWRRFGTSRLAAVIHGLRADGWDIGAESIAVTTAARRTAHVALYRLNGGHDAP